MTITIRPVDSKFVNQTWPLVHKFIEESQDKGISSDRKNYTAEHMRVYVTTGQWLLIVAADENNEVHGAATMSFINYPLNRVAFITAMGGKLVSNKDTFEQLKAIAKHHGATKIQAMARPAMARLMRQYDFEATNTLMETTL